MERKRPTAPLLPLLSLALALCHPAFSNGFPNGEWAVRTAEGEVTGVLQINPDGTAVSKVDDSHGQYFTLNDGRVLLVISDIVMIGNVAELEKSFAFEGSFFAASQPLAIQLIESSPAKLKQAKKNHEATTKMIEESQAKQLDQLILQNLAALAAAFQLHMLIEGTQQAEYSDVVGEGKFLPGLNSYHGERYENLSAQSDTKALSVKDADGAEHLYQF